MATRVFVPGVNGKMARAIRAVVAESTEFESVDALEQAQLVIDFTSSLGTKTFVSSCTDRSIPIVIGTTAIDDATAAQITEAARRIAIVKSANMSLGVNLLAKLVADAARALGSDYDVELVETHHRAKKDAPSGTALMLADAIAAARGTKLDDQRNDGRHGLGARLPGEIGLHAVRGGDVVGDHTIHFLGSGERIELTHRASSRETFARGALAAGRWLIGRAPGLYDMHDVLGRS